MMGRNIVFMLQVLLLFELKNKIIGSRGIPLHLKNYKCSRLCILNEIAST